MRSIFNRLSNLDIISSYYHYRSGFFPSVRFEKLGLCRFRNLPMPIIIGRCTYCSILVGLMFPASEGLMNPIQLRGGIQRSFHLSSELYHSSSLVQEIRQAYKDDQTDGILKLATHMWGDDRFHVDEMVSATLEATEGKKGEVASIMNALMASCCQMEDREAASVQVRELLGAYETLEETRNITPDMVTFSLAYKALSLDPDSADLASLILDRALRRSKKIAGNKRRKTLAASRRKNFSTCSTAEDKLKTLLGEDFDVLYETEDLFIINKPSGVSCFHKKKTSAGKIKKGKQTFRVSDVSLEDALINCNVPLSTLNSEGLGLVHRIDRGTSGCMVLAKTEEMHAKLVSEFFLRQTEKKYLVIVAPAPDISLPEEGYIDLPVDRRPAKSKYRVLERYGTAAALLEFEIFTGRKHQIRVHAAQGLSSPVLMDSMYSSGEHDTSIVEGIVKIDESKSQFFLHASSLSIPEYRISVKAPLPSWWDSTISLLKKY